MLGPIVLPFRDTAADHALGLSANSSITRRRKWSSDVSKRVKLALRTAGKSASFKALTAGDASARAGAMIGWREFSDASRGQPRDEWTILSVCDSRAAVLFWAGPAPQPLSAAAVAVLCWYIVRFIIALAHRGTGVGTEHSTVSINTSSRSSYSTSISPRLRRQEPPYWTSRLAHSRSVLRKRGEPSEAWPAETRQKRGAS